MMENFFLFVTLRELIKLLKKRGAIQMVVVVVVVILVNNVLVN